MTVPEFLGPLVADPAAAAVVSDFDGTLAPIVADPARARPLPAAVAALRDLVASLGLVAVVSGRPVAYLRAHLPVAGLVVAGIYGLERLVGDEVVTDGRAVRFVAAVEAAAREAEARWPALTVERKGTVAFTVHWRRAPHAAPTRETLQGLAASHGLDLAMGRQSAEVLVPVPVDKGTVVATLLDERRTRACVFAGDDTGDRPAFAALTRRAATQAGFVGIRIAVRSAEAPPGLLADADHVLDGPPALAALLVGLAAEFRPRG